MARRQGSDTPLFSEVAERSIIGICLQHKDTFWDMFGKIRPEFFQVPRLARIWAAMVKCAEANRPITRNYIPLFIQNDVDETTPISVFLTVLINDAPPSSEAEAYAETVVHLYNKRALLDSLDRTKAEILKLDVGTPVEDMLDLGITSLSNSVDTDFDRDMKTYEQWGQMVFAAAAEKVRQGESAHTGLPTGLSAVTNAIGKLLPGKLIVLAGMSSSGKSALVRQIMEAAATEAAVLKLGHAFVSSLEMTGQEYAIRHLSEMLGMPSFQIEEGNMNAASVEMLGQWSLKMRNLPIIIDQRGGLTMDQVRSRALRVKNKYGLCAMAVDHLLLVKGGKNQSISDRVAEATMNGKNLAKELEIPVIMLAQLDEKRMLETSHGMPNTSHLFGGQTITQNADVVAFIHRPEVILAKKEPEADTEAHAKWVIQMDKWRGTALIWNNKRRGGAPNSKYEMRFDGPTMSFRDI